MPKSSLYEEDVPLFVRHENGGFGPATRTSPYRKNIRRSMAGVKNTKSSGPELRRADCRLGRPIKRPNEARPLPPCLHTLFIVPALLGRHQGILLKDMNVRRLLGHEDQRQVTDDPVDDRRLGQKGRDICVPDSWGHVPNSGEFVTCPRIGKSPPKIKKGRPGHNRRNAGPGRGCLLRSNKVS